GPGVTPIPSHPKGPSRNAARPSDDVLVDEGHAPRADRKTVELGTHPRASGASTPTVAGDLHVARMPERIRIAPGRELPGTRYRIVSLVGEGAMGSVYEAEHIDIGRHVALKILHPEHCGNPRVVEMFRDEARAARRIGSSHIVEVFDFDELSDGRVLFAMELLEAMTLTDAMQDGPIEAGRMIGILRQACKAI